MSKPGTHGEVLAVAVLGAILLGSSSCGARSGALTFAVGGAPAELAAWEEVAQSFQQETGIAVAVQRMPANSAEQRQSLLIAMKAGQPDPDVFLMDVAWVGAWITAGWLAPLGDVDQNAFFPEVLQKTDMADGKIVALPVYLDAGLLYYRTDLLKEAGINGPPQTWDDLVSSAIRVQKQQQEKDPGFRGFVWQGAQYEGLIVNFLEFAGAAGGFRTNGPTVRVEMPANVRALQLMQDSIWRDRISPPNTYTEMREEQTRSFFQSGHALYERNWSYVWALHESQDSPVRGRVEVASVPGPKPGEATPTLGGYHVGVSAFSDAKDKALRFAGYITSRAVQKSFALKLGWNPGRSDLYEDPEILKHFPHLARLKDVYRNARPRPAVPDYTLISDEISGPFSAVLSRDKSPSEGLHAAQQAIDRLEFRYGYRTNAAIP